MSDPAAAAAAAPAVAAPAAAVTPAELKKRAKAEKQARRAAEKEAKGISAGGPQTAQQQQQQSQSQHGGQKAERQDRQVSVQQAPVQGQLPACATCAAQSALQEAAAAAEKEKKAESKNVELCSHLYAHPRRQNVDGASKDVLPVILALGFQFSSYEITGSTARCVAMLNAFKEAIQQYTTPKGTSLARHMTAHHLSPQIEYLKSCRPLSESMGNSIRWLKKLIVEVDPSTPEQEAKDHLCASIDNFIQERIEVTDQAIATTASQQIEDGAVVLTYAKSSIVEKTILLAHASGVKFSVVCIDSRPLYEGKKLATSLMQAGLKVEYTAFHGLANAMTHASVVLLGAHSMLSNGRLQSRIGTAAVAMTAHQLDVPVVVCCESVKFSGKVALDSIASNEVAPAEELLPPPITSTIHGVDDEETKSKTLDDWKEIPNLQILNLMYDTTPADFIDMVICEYGSVPPSSVPVVHRLANEGE